MCSSKALVTTAVTDENRQTWMGNAGGSLQDFKLVILVREKVMHIFLQRHAADREVMNTLVRKSEEVG